MELFLEILTWLGLAFLAGFVGQFGKSLTQKILARRRENREGPTGGGQSGIDSPENREKLEKKRVKSEIKLRKKNKGREDV